MQIVCNDTEHCQSVSSTLKSKGAVGMNNVCMGFYFFQKVHTWTLIKIWVDLWDERIDQWELD